jgi:hypothetical protein
MVLMGSIPPLALAFLFVLLLGQVFVFGQANDDSDTIYSGTVETLTAEKLTVSREILGNPPEYMSFILTPQTKVEGKLQEGVRVTVKFRPSDDGPIAETVIVREQARPRKKN